MAQGFAVRLSANPDDAVNGAASAEVTECLGQPTRYRLTYSLDSVDGDFPLLKESKLGPDSDLSIIVTTADGSECLVRGPVGGQEMSFVHGGSGSTLVVTGADSSIKLDREDKVFAWADVTDSDAVSKILTTANLSPTVETTTAGHAELKHTLIQRESDLSFIRRLARRNGSLFWVRCDAEGTETSFFQRPKLDGEAECDLIINLTDPRPNVTDLEIMWDVECPTSVDATELDLNTKSDITGAVARSPLTALGGSALADIALGTRSAHIAMPVDDQGDLQARGEAVLIDSSFFVRAKGSTTLSVLGKVLRAHTLVNLRGVGTRHSGIWFCAYVNHVIEENEHVMNFELVRNGWTE
ncbi:MAG TPA: hypothetical protein VI306_18725 [Pyrinomonadaceae bacterium]